LEDILLQRSKNLKPIPRFFRFFLVLVAIVWIFFYFFSFKASEPSVKDILKSVLGSLRQVETLLRDKNNYYQKRAETLFSKYLLDKLTDSQMESKEALILENNGVVKTYWGEIYFLKFLPLSPGKWGFIEKNRDIYYVRKMADHIYYIRYYSNLDDHLLLKNIKYTTTVSEIRFSNTALEKQKNGYHFDRITGMFFYTHCLLHANNQLVLNLKFSMTDIQRYDRQRESIFLLICGFLFLLLLQGVCVFYLKYYVLSRWLWLLMFLDLFFLLPMIIGAVGENTLYLQWQNHRIAFHSIYRMLVFLVFLVSLLYLLRKWFKYKSLVFVLFNTTLLFVLQFFPALFNAVNFNFQTLGFNYLALLLCLVCLHLLPLIFVRGICHEFYQGLENTRDRVIKGTLYLLLECIILVGMSHWFTINIISGLLIVLISFVFLFFKRSFITRAIVIFILAVSIYQLTQVQTLLEKQWFVSDNLKKIFLNQSNYAKFIAREIIHQINSDSLDLYEFFQGDTSTKLESIWRRTMASRENIASGIFVIAENNTLMGYFAFQIPFLEAKTRNTFPFWAIEDTTAEIQGKDIPLAVASTSIYKEGQYLGRMIIQVLNSPELLLRHQESVNIFTIDNKINGKDLSYIKLNEQNQILENPSNLNLENIAGILKEKNKWIGFTSMGLTYRGFIFKDGGNSIIIFFPQKTLFKELAELIKLFLFLSLFYLLFVLKNIKKIDWRSIYYSYSIRVFTFLILISLFTAVVFSVFFINFSYRNSEEKVMRIMYENGRMAQNIGYNLFKDRGVFSREHLFSIAKILNGDVTVYDKNGLLEASNYRQIINSAIPVFIHSHTLSLLNQKNQRFVLSEEYGGFRLFFKIYDYIFMVEYSNRWEETLSEGRYYSDFVITLFFILMIIGFSIAVFFRNKILSPIEGLNHGMAEVERGNLPILKNIPAEIEIKSLYTGFNAMIEGIREQQQNISEISQMKTIIRLGRQVAHEVKNPLTPIQLSAEQILRSLHDKNPNYEEIIKESVNYIIAETDHLRKVSYGFLDLSKIDEIKLESFDLVRLCQDEIFNLQQIYSHVECSIQVDGATVTPATPVNVRVTMDRSKIKQVLKNLINNSIEAIGEKMGEVHLDIKRQNQRLILTVSDNGIGMEENECGHLFETNYSTKVIGTGLGLFIAKRIVELHKGTIRIQSQKNVGTAVILDFPQQAEES